MINGSTQLVGIIGCPLSHTLSPAMHNTAFEHLGLNWRYVPLLVNSTNNIVIQEAVYGLRALGFRGANVTVPHKESVLPFMDDLSEEAQAIGAVNTIVVQKNRLVGHNTDAAGFLRDLQEHKIDPAQPSVVLGAGGSARAIAHALLKAGCAQLTIVNRTLERARQLGDKLIAQFPEARIYISENIPDSAFVVNCSSGTNVYGLDPRNKSGDGRTTYDLNYKNSPYALNGLGMLLYQGALSFELWTGEQAPIDIMKRALHV